MPTAEDLFGRLRRLDLPAGDYAVFGSGPILARGLIAEANDLDVLCRGEAWDLVCQVGDLVEIEEGVRIVSIDQGLLTFGRSWAYGSFDIDELIDTADDIDGLPFVRIEHVIAFKRAADRSKDREHLRLLGEDTRS